MKLPSALLRAARAAQRRAHAPYSQFKVGAAVLTKSGKVFTGCNVENASYGLTMCAERVAIGKAISEGQRAFRAIAIVAPGDQVTPCGACRQVLAEFGDFEVYCADSRSAGKPHTYRVSQLLPGRFSLSAASARRRAAGSGRAERPDSRRAGAGPAAHNLLAADSPRA